MVWPFPKQKNNDGFINDIVKVVGLYSLEEDHDLYLIEVIINANSNDLVSCVMTQENPDLPLIHWQSAHGECYLNDSGDEILGDGMNMPVNGIEPCRLVFFMYFVDFQKPLITQFGNVSLPKPSLMPDRLKKILNF